MKNITCNSKTTYEIDALKARIEAIMSKMMRAEIEIYRNDKRLLMIYDEIKTLGAKTDDITDEEIKKYAKEYYPFSDAFIY
ncbi:MAG: hypothetical protein JW778_04990 [Candidatus Altiarchaeota archaeon]|nr:hypothetical protein [Candidatus Altiarchaeota archaeon]